MNYDDYGSADDALPGYICLRKEGRGKSCGTGAYFQQECKKLEGGMLKLARPALKKTPMAVVMDDIDMMVMYSISQKADEKEKQFAQQAINLLESYNKVSEIDDPDYRMCIYIDNPVGENFSEIILYISRPDPSIMVFVGDFTIGSLKKVG